MTRLNIFEFADKRWCPPILRDMLTEYLGYLFGKLMNTYKPVVPIIKKILQITRRRQIVELCAGTGFNGSLLQEEFVKMGEPVTVTLTDKFPNVTVFKRAQEKNHHLRIICDSVDAAKVPASIEGIRVMYTSFHHFEPRLARKILQDAVDKGEAICIFEMTELKLGSFLMTLLSPFITLGLAPRVMHPIGLKRFVVTYIVPAFLFIVLWDGIVSMLRTYTLFEMGMLVKGLRRDGYMWHIGRENGKLPYLVGYPNGAIKQRSLDTLGGTFKDKAPSSHI